jgi:hypothetical protein
MFIALPEILTKAGQFVAGYESTLGSGLSWDAKDG